MRSCRFFSLDVKMTPPTNEIKGFYLLRKRKNKEDIWYTYAHTDSQVQVSYRRLTDPKQLDKGNFSIVTVEGVYSDERKELIDRFLTDLDQDFKKKDSIRFLLASDYEWKKTGVHVEVYDKNRTRCSLFFILAFLTFPFLSALFPLSLVWYLGMNVPILFSLPFVYLKWIRIKKKSFRYFLN